MVLVEQLCLHIHTHTHICNEIHAAFWSSGNARVVCVCAGCGSDKTVMYLYPRTHSLHNYKEKEILCKSPDFGMMRYIRILSVFKRKMDVMERRNIG